MLPEIWGRYGWNFLHLVTFNYPDNPTELDKEHFFQFFYSLQYILPCGKCRYNLSNHLKKYPLTAESLSSKTNLVKWCIDLHNIVNYYIGKPMLTYTEAINEINKLINPQQNSKKWIIYLLILIVVLMIIIFFVLYNRTKKN